MWRWRTASTVIPQEQNFLFFFFKQGLSLVWSLLSGLGWLTRHLLVSASPIRQLQVCTTMGDFFMWGQASHSEPCACQISALLVALFPQLQDIILNLTQSFLDCLNSFFSISTPSSVIAWSFLIFNLRVTSQWTS